MSASATTARATAAAPGPLAAGTADYADDLLGHVHADDARPPGGRRPVRRDRERGRVGRTGRLMSDPDGDVTPSGWFIHDRHSKRGVRHSLSIVPAGTLTAVRSLRAWLPLEITHAEPPFGTLLVVDQPGVHCRAVLGILLASMLL